MKKGDSHMMWIIISVILGLLGLAVLLGLFTDGVWKSWEGISSLIGMKDTDYLVDKAIDDYQQGGYVDAIDSSEMVLQRDPNSNLRDDARMFLALSYAAMKDYDKAKKQLELLADDPFAKDSKTIIEGLITTSSNPVPKYSEWKCCDLGQYGHYWVFGICAGQCSASGSCPEDKCKTKKPRT